MVDMKIVFLGTSAAIPTKQRGLSSVALLRGNEILLFDTGEGMQKNFLFSGLGINKKMKIFFTHLHADHCIGILGLLQTMTLLGRKKKIDIFGEPRLKQFLLENIKIINFGLSFEINIHTINNDGIIVQEPDYNIACCTANHSVLAYSYCIQELDRPGIFNVNQANLLNIPRGEMYKKLQTGEDILVNGVLIKPSQVLGPARKGRKIGISGDTRPSPGLENFFKNCDILIFESTYDHSNLENAVRTFHSTAIEAATIAKNTDSKKLILTHFSSRYKDTSMLLEEAKSIHLNVELAEDLKKIYIPYPN
jgi:ribonuclease Z